MDPVKKTIEQWAADKQTAAWQFAAAKQGERWPVGLELTEPDYDAAIRRAASIRIK